MKGIPLPIALNIIRVITFPLGRIFGPKLEKLLNMSFFTFVISVVLGCVVGLFCSLFYVISVGATFVAGLLMVVVTEEDNSWGGRGSSVASNLSSTRRAGQTCIGAMCSRISEVFKVIVQLVELFVIAPPFFVAQTLYLLVYKLPRLVIAASVHGLRENYTIVRTIINDQQKHGRRGRRTRDVRKVHRNQLWKKLADEACQVAPKSDGEGDDLMKWSDLYEIMLRLEIPESHYSWSTDDVGDDTNETTIKSNRSSDPVVTASLRLSDRHSEEWDEVFVESSIFLHHAFYFDKIDSVKVKKAEREKEKGKEGGLSDSESEDEDYDEEDFVILYRDFISYIMDNQREMTINQDETDVLPFLRAVDIVKLTNPGLRANMNAKLKKAIGGSPTMRATKGEGGKKGGGVEIVGKLENLLQSLRSMEGDEEGGEDERKKSHHNRAMDMVHATSSRMGSSRRSLGRQSTPGQAHHAAHHARRRRSSVDRFKEQVNQAESEGLRDLVHEDRISGGGLLLGEEMIIVEGVRGVEMVSQGAEIVAQGEGGAEASI